MLNIKEFFAVSSLVLSLAGNVPYIYGTLVGKVKPERIAWLLWTLLGATYYGSAVLEEGAILFTRGELIGPVIILLLSIKYGVGGRTKLDVYSLIVALVAFGFLIITNNALLSLILAIIVDAIGIGLTIKKLSTDPASESKLTWGIWFVSALCAIISLESYSPVALLFPVYVLVCSAVVYIKTEPYAHKNNPELKGRRI